MVDTKLVIEPGEAIQVKEIFQLYLDYQGLIPVVQELKRRNWRQKQWITKKGKKLGGSLFNKTNLWNLLTNVVYLGKVKHKGAEYEGEHESIIEVELFEKVQSLLRLNRQQANPVNRNKHGALLKGLLHCSVCNCGMTPTYSQRNGKQYRYYLCTRAQKHGWNTCPAKSIPAHEIEELVVQQIKLIGENRALVTETYQQTQDQHQVKIREIATKRERLNSALKSCHQELNSLLTLRPSAQVTKRMADIQSRITKLEPQLQNLVEEDQQLKSLFLPRHHVEQELAKFNGIWDALNTREKIQLINLIVQRVELNGNTGELEIRLHSEELISQENDNA